MGRVNHFFNMGKISFNPERTATVSFPRFFAVAVGSRLNERRIDRPWRGGRQEGAARVLRRIRKGEPRGRLSRRNRGEWNRANNRKYLIEFLDHSAGRRLATLGLHASVTSTGRLKRWPSTCVGRPHRCVQRRSACLLRSHRPTRLRLPGRAFCRGFVPRRDVANPPRRSQVLPALGDAQGTRTGREGCRLKKANRSPSANGWPVGPRRRYRGSVPLGVAQG